LLNTYPCGLSLRERLRGWGEIRVAVSSGAWGEELPGGVGFSSSSSLSEFVKIKKLNHGQNFIYESA